MAARKYALTKKYALNRKHALKLLKHGRWGVRKERVEGRKAYNDGQEATRERNSRRFLL